MPALEVFYSRERVRISTLYAAIGKKYWCHFKSEPSTDCSFYDRVQEWVLIQEEIVCRTLSEKKTVLLRRKVNIWFLYFRIWKLTLTFKQF